MNVGARFHVKTITVLLREGSTTIDDEDGNKAPIEVICGDTYLTLIDGEAMTCINHADIISIECRPIEAPAGRPLSPRGAKPGSVPVPPRT